MKVIYDLIHFARTGWFGGISRMWLEYFKRLPGSPIEPTFITGPAVNPVQEYLETHNYFGAPVIRESPRGIFRKARKVSFYRNFQLLKLNHGDGHTVFHSTDYINPLIKLNGLKVVTTIHDMVFWDREEAFVKNISYWGQVWSTYHSLWVSDCIITPSETSRRAISRHFPWAAAKIVVTPHGIDESFRGVEIIMNKEKSFLFIGGRNCYKNYDTLLEAFSRFISLFPDWKLEVVGGTNAQIQQQERERYQHLGISSHVIDHGFVSQERLVQLLQHAGALIIPSLNEGFNFPLLEGMASGTPVLSSDIPTSRELGKEYARFFFPSSADEIVKAMKGIATNPPSYEHLIRAQRYARGFEWSESFRKLLKVYSACLGHIDGSPDVL